MSAIASENTVRAYRDRLAGLRQRGQSARVSIGPHPSHRQLRRYLSRARAGAVFARDGESPLVGRAHLLPAGSMRERASYPSRPRQRAVGPQAADSACRRSSSLAGRCRAARPYTANGSMPTGAHEQYAVRRCAIRRCWSFYTPAARACPRLPGCCFPRLTSTRGR